MFPLRSSKNPVVVIITKSTRKLVVMGPTKTLLLLLCNLLVSIYAATANPFIKPPPFTTELSSFIEPLIPCQFVMNLNKVEPHSEESQTYIFPGIVSRLLASIMEAEGSAEIVTDLQLFSRSGYITKHTEVCIVHLSILPYFGPTDPLYYYWAHRVMYQDAAAASVNWHTDMIVIFKDATKRWARGEYAEQFSRYHCEIPVNFLILEYNEQCQINDEPQVVLMHRDGYPEPSYSSAQSLNLKLVGMSFRNVVTQIKELRTNFYEASVRLSRFGMTYMPEDMVYEPKCVRQNRQGVATKRNLIGPYLELGAKFNFTIVVRKAYNSSVFGDDDDDGGQFSCQTGRLYTGTIFAPTDHDESARLYNIFWREVESLRVIHVTDISKSSNPLKLRNTLAPFEPHVLLLIGGTTALVGVVAAAVLKLNANKFRWNVLYKFTISTLLTQNESFGPKRTAGLLLLWTCAIFFIQSHYLALLQSFVISPRLIESRKSFGQLEKEGYKFWMEKRARNVAAGFYDYFAALQKSKSLAKDQLLLTAVDADRGFFNTSTISPFKLVTAKKAAFVGWEFQQKVVIKELSRLGKNVHLLDDEYLRYVLWYRIMMPNEDVVMEAFQLLVSTGIVQLWEGVAADIVAERTERKVRNGLFGEDDQNDTESSGQQNPISEVTTTGKELDLLDLLVLESFTLLGEGMFVCVVITIVFQAWAKRGTRVESMVLVLSGAKENNVVTAKVRRQVLGFCPHCHAKLEMPLETQSKQQSQGSRKAITPPEVSC